MATVIISHYPEDEPTLTSRIDTVTATTDRPKVSVSVTRDPDGEIDEFFGTTLYAYEGRVQLCSLGSLIEERMREKGRYYDTIQVTIDGESVEFLVLYCEWVLDQDFNYKSCYYSAAGTSIVHIDSHILLSHWPRGTNEYRIRAVGMDADGRQSVVEGTFARVSTSIGVDFSVRQIVEFALNNSTLTKVAYFAINYGDIQKLYYIAEDPEYLTFRYRNIFNVPEYVDVVGKMARKTKKDSDIAVCGGRAKEYNRSVSRIYEVQTAALTEDQAREMEQMLASHEVRLCTGSEAYDIIITDHTCEVDNDDDTLISVKFSFRFANTRPALRDSEMGSLLSNTSHIFTDQYTSEFS